MPCLNAIPFLREAVDSVLSQPECLELLVADGGSSDGSLDLLDELTTTEPRLRVVSRKDAGPADALNQAIACARGTLIGWLNADDLYTPGSLSRGYEALKSHPDWIMVYGEGEEFNKAGYHQRYPTLTPDYGIEGFRSHCFICQPTILFRKTMFIMLGSFNKRLKTAFDFDYWLRAFDSFPQRIGFIPEIQGLTRLHETTITSRERTMICIEAIQLIARYFGTAPIDRLYHYGLELQDGIAEVPNGLTLLEHLSQIANDVEPYLKSKDLQAFREAWQLA